MDPDQDQQERRPGTIVTSPSGIVLSELSIVREQDGGYVRGLDRSPIHQSRA